MKKTALLLATVALALTGCSAQKAVTSYDQNQLDTPVAPVVTTTSNQTDETNPWDRVATKQYREELENGRYRYCTALVGYESTRLQPASVQATSLHCSEVFEADGSKTQ